MSVRISFVALAAYPLLDENASGGIGGAEVRAVTFARGLQRQTDHSLEFIVSKRPGMLPTASGITIRPYVKRRGLRRTISKLGQSLSKRLTNLPPRDAFYQQLESDVVLCFGVRNDTASIIRSAGESGKRSVLFLTSDRNIEDAKRNGCEDRGVYGEIGHLCRYAMLNADRVVVQTKWQQRELRDTLGIEGRLIRNPIEPDGEFSIKQLVGAKSTALWVGRADSFSKRADLCLALARRCPNVRFVMIMNNHDDATFQQLKQHASSNVEIIEKVPFSKVESYFQRASLLLNTSAAEGFPNTFLQAGKYGCPVVSLVVDPAEMLSQYRCGICCRGDLEKMAAELRRLNQQGDEYDVLSTNIRHYVVSNHNAQSCCQQLNGVLEELLASHRSKVA